MSGLSSGGEAAVLTPLTTSAYISLHTADPTDTGVNEVAGGSYARQGPVSFTSTGNNPTVAANSTAIIFPVASAGWGTIAYFGLWSAASGGTFRGSAALSSSRAVNSGDQVQFAGSALTLTAN
jgi:hypothetical protein